MLNRFSHASRVTPHASRVRPSGEFIQALLFALGVVQASYLPYLAGRPRQTEERALRGTLFNDIDANVYRAAISNLGLLAGCTLAAAFHSPLMFRLSGKYLVAGWPQANAARSEPVLGTSPSSNLLPAVSGERTVIGHWNLTRHYYARKAQVEDFNASDTGEPRRDDLMRLIGAQSVYLGPSEIAIGRWRPDGEGCGDEVYRDADVTIYRVRP